MNDVVFGGSDNGFVGIYDDLCVYFVEEVVEDSGFGYFCIVFKFV